MSALLGVAHVLAFAAGVTVVLATWQSIIVTIILPRRSRNGIGLAIWVATYRVVTALARVRGVERGDGYVALLGPVNIVALLFGWMALFVAGFGLVFWSFAHLRLADAFDLAGSSMFTLGIAAGTPGLLHALMYVCAASGMILVGLQIGYLPTIYSAYSAREALVTLLNMRCQENGVITGALVLAHHPLPESSDLLAGLFASWEACAAAIIESHTNYPWLIVFASPRASESWVTSMLAMLDAIAMLEAVAPSAVPPQAKHCRFACATTLRELAAMLIPKPESGGTVSRLTAAEFERALVELRGSLPAERSAAQAWETFRSLRTEYEAAALELGTFLRRRNDGWLRPLAIESASRPHAARAAL